LTAVAGVYCHTTLIVWCVQHIFSKDSSDDLITRPDVLIAIAAMKIALCGVGAGLDAEHHILDVYWFPTGKGP
jgi:hypothetical protein